MRKLRLGRKQIIAALAAGVAAVSFAAPVNAADFKTRFVRLDPAGDNPQVNNHIEARGILDGTVTDVTLAEDVTGTVDIIDFAGGGGNFAVDNPYTNGVNDASMVDFVQQATGWVRIPAGTYTIGFGSDDGGVIKLPGINFTDTLNTNGDTDPNDSELWYVGNRGHSWTVGTFTVDEEFFTLFDTSMHERGGGDSLEVAVIEGADLMNNGGDIAATWELLTDGAAGWSVEDFTFTPGDFNDDGSIDTADFDVLASNFHGSAAPLNGNINFDGAIDLQDFVEFKAVFDAAGAGAASVPEPSTVILLGLGASCLLLAGRRRTRR